jgi:hypothetical protein
MHHTLTRTCMAEYTPLPDRWRQVPERPPPAHLAVGGEAWQHPKKSDARLPCGDDLEEPPSEGGQGSQGGQVLPEENGAHLAGVVVVKHRQGLRQWGRREAGELDPVKQGAKDRLGQAAGSCPQEAATLRMDAKGSSAWQGRTRGRRACSLNARDTAKLHASGQRFLPSRAPGPCPRGAVLTCMLMAVGVVLASKMVKRNTGSGEV